MDCTKCHDGPIVCYAIPQSGELRIPAKCENYFGVNFGTLLIGRKKDCERYHNVFGTLFAGGVRFSVAVFRNDGGDLVTQYSTLIRNPASGLAESGVKWS